MQLKYSTFATVCLALILFGGCSSSPSPRAAEILMDGRMGKVTGLWKLARIGPDGHAPKSEDEQRTLVFANGVGYEEHLGQRFSFAYRFVDDSHIEILWTTSTNPEDQARAPKLYQIGRKDDTLQLDEDMYELSRH